MSRMPPSLSMESDLHFISADTIRARALKQQATTVDSVDVRSRMSRRVSKRSDLKFISADTLLARALRKEDAMAQRAVVKNAQIGAEHIEVHKCSYSVAVDGTVGCKGCGKGTVKKVSHRGKKHGKPTKRY